MLEVVERDVGDETEPPLIDADQRHAIAGELAADAEHGAVAADDQAQVALLADGRHGQHLMPGDPHVERRIALQVHLAALAVQKIGDLLDDAARQGPRRTRRQRLVLANQGHVGEF